MANITIYTKPACPYCAAAKALLKSKGQTFDEINVEADAQKKEEMIEKSGGRLTVPQVFINGQHIGGFDDLKALDQRGELASLLR